jgi:hypothetical protein
MFVHEIDQNNNIIASSRTYFPLVYKFYYAWKSADYVTTIFFV